MVKVFFCLFKFSAFKNKWDSTTTLWCALGFQVEEMASINAR
jgi:hypothetical protein